ncbi:MAG: alpha/beta fold hydrolase [Parvularculaceae bacterium]|nr:alpha/beta fold hydrolase [Parvularculaceae bacterium]
MIRILAALAAGLFLASCGEKTLTAPPADGSAVGMTRRAYEDAERLSWDRRSARPLATTIWSPTAAPAKTMTEIAYPVEDPIFIGGWATRDAEPASGEKAPLIILSHGTGGSAFQMMWLGRRLAAKGYIVAAVDHHGNTAAEPTFDPRGFKLPWERARDVSAVIDHLLADPVYGPRIDPERIGAAGFSLGGYTMAALAGARTSLDLFSKFCSGPERDATCAAQSEFPEADAKFEAMLKDNPALRVELAEHKGSFADPRIKSFVLIAPALAQALTDESLLTVTAPTLVIGASADEIAPPATNAKRIAGKFRRARYEEMDGARHYSFLNICAPKKMRRIRICRDAPGYDRSAGHDKVADLADQHFQQSFASQTSLDALR